MSSRASGPRLHDLQPAPLANAEFGQPANPGILAGDLFDLGPLSGLQHVERHEHGEFLDCHPY